MYSLWQGKSYGNVYIGPNNGAMVETMKLEACRILLWSAIVANVKSQRVDISTLQPH